MAKYYRKGNPELLPETPEAYPLEHYPLPNDGQQVEILQYKNRPDLEVHPQFNWLLKCKTCGTYRDRDHLFEYPYDRECLPCEQKARRLAMGMYTPDNPRSGAVKAARRQILVDRKQAEADLELWREARMLELQQTGIPVWEHYARIQQEEPAMRAELGLAPPQS